MEKSNKTTQRYNPETFLEEIEYVISQDEFDQLFEKATELVTKEVTVPGFRKGHAPKNAVLKNHFQAISDKAINLAIDIAVRNLPELQPRPLDLLNVKSVMPAKDGGFTILFTYIPMPEIKLGEFDKVKVKKNEPKKATDEEVEKELAAVWLHYYQKVNSEAKKEDFNFDKLDGDFFEKTDIKKDNPNITNAEELKSFLKDYINHTYDADRDIEWERQVQEELIKASSFKKIEALIEKELENRVKNYKARFEQIGMNAEEYMQKNNVKEEDLKADWKPEAERDIKFELILQKYGEENKFEPSEEEMEQNLSSLDDETKKIHASDPDRLKSLIRYYYINQKSYKDILEKVKANSEPEKSKEKKEKK